MKRFIFLSKLKVYLENRQTARCASVRLRNMLTEDRELAHGGVTKKLSAELSEVLARYFTVTDFCFRIEGSTERMRYTMEAELAKM